MADLSKEACLRLANAADVISRTSVSNATLRTWAEDQSPIIAQALRIAARVLDEGAVEKVAGVIDEIVDARTSYNEEAYIRNTDEVSQAIIDYLKTGEEHSK